MPYRDDEVDTSSCYVMPVMLDDAEVREPLRAQAARADACRPACSTRRSTSSPPTRAPSEGSLPRTELAARTELTLPLFPPLTESDQDHVVSVLRESLAALERERSLA